MAHSMKNKQTETTSEKEGGHNRQRILKQLSWRY